jgi:His-Xaa-Ser system protein HxsD
MKKPPKKSRVAARPKHSRRKEKSATRELAFLLDPKVVGAEPIFGAAYLLMDRAFASIERVGARKLRVTLRPKSQCGRAQLAELKTSFESEFAAQKLRWAVARNNKPIREYIAENALSLAAEFAARPAAQAAPAADELSSSQRSEIERLIAEVETEISQMNQTKAPDAKSVALSWEAAREAEKGGSTT